MKKKLHISAIIPNDLYIQRDADRILEEVILRMSKPAYIAVARQMGKTNLLIHTKRKLENEENRYVFIDITNQFQNSHDCFRYIIDQIIDANEDIEQFRQAGAIIRSKRLPLTNHPTKEYQDELRTILKSYKGNLVIFLDEVDDLRKHQFSDEVFAQIRKNYFIRVTYPEFERLSYVLSGVIDPEKLIKNKDNSPFNIAIPVYLDDFSKDEFSQLVSKTEILIDASIIEYVYEWLMGNPRMSFDVMSRLEDLFLEGKKVNKELVDEVINDIYLKSYKNPPIDHIRDLVKHNTEIRKAVIKLKQGSMELLSDDIKNKLYLFGIIGSRVDKEAITIKNKVINLSLSKEWLDQIELEKSGYYELGNDKIAEGLYDEGIEYLKEYLQNTPKGRNVNLANFTIGRAYHLKEQYRISNEYLLSKPISLEQSLDLYYTQLLYIAINYLKEGEFDDALKYFDEIIEKAINENTIIASLLNRGETLINKKDYEGRNVEEDFYAALQLIENNDRKEDKAFLTGIYYRLGYLKLNENKNIARKYFVEALQHAKDVEKPSILLYLNMCDSDDIESQKIYCIKAADIIINNKLRFLKKSAVVDFNYFHVFFWLNNLLLFNYEEKFSELFYYQKQNLNEQNLSEADLLELQAEFATQFNQEEVAIILYKKILNLEDVNIKVKGTAFRQVGVNSLHKKDYRIGTEYLQKYIEIFVENNNFNEEIKSTDLTAFTVLASYHRQQKQFEKSYEVCKNIESYFNSELSLELKSLFAVVFYFIMDYFHYKGDIRSAISYAERNLRLMEEVKNKTVDLTYGDNQFLLNLEQITKGVLKNFSSVLSKIEPIKVTREKGRNEWVKVKYKNGNEVIGKFKKFKEDIEKGDCIVLE